MSARMHLHNVDAARLTIRTDQELIALEPHTACINRFPYTPENDLGRKPSFAVTLPPAGAPLVAFRVEELPKALSPSIDTLFVELDRWTTAFTYWASSKPPLYLWEIAINEHRSSETDHTACHCLRPLR